MNGKVLWKYTTIVPKSPEFFWQAAIIVAFIFACCSLFFGIGKLFRLLGLCDWWNVASAGPLCGLWLNFNLRDSRTHSTVYYCGPFSFSGLLLSSYFMQSEVGEVTTKKQFSNNNFVEPIFISGPPPLLPSLYIQKISFAVFDGRLLSIFIGRGHGIT